MSSPGLVWLQHTHYCMWAAAAAAASAAAHRDILRSQTGLAEHHDNYHEFCRLLGRLKTNYQLSELVSDS